MQAVVSRPLTGVPCLLLVGGALELRYSVGNDRILLQLLEDSIFVFVFGLTYLLHFLPKCHETGKKAF